jgi:hypothetical protein
MDRQHDTNIVLCDDTKENRQRALLGQIVRTKTTHVEDPFVEELRFVRFERFGKPWIDTVTVFCKGCECHGSKKILQVYVEKDELTNIAVASARNATELTAMLGYVTKYINDPTSKHYHEESANESEEEEEDADRLG